MILSPLNKINLDYKKGKISKIEDMLKNHPYLINQFQGLDTERTLFLLRELYMKSERSKDKKFIIGAVEMGIINPNEICKIIDLSVSEGIDFLFERAGNNDNIPKIKKINTSLFKLKPLISIKDFAKDAIKHKTCILGHYNNAVYNEKAVYYSLEVGKETASVYLYDGKIIQYYGINNAELPSFRHTIIKILLEIIHGRKLKSIISDIIAPKKSSIFSRVYKIINNRKRKTNTSNVYREPIIDFMCLLPF